MGVPVINIGTRQQGRDRGNNVVDVDYNEKEIFSAINQSLKDKRPLSSNVYGGGDAGKKIAQILGDIKLRYHKKINF